MLETLSTSIRDDEGERVEFNNSIGELNQKVKVEYAIVLAEDITFTQCQLTQFQSSSQNTGMTFYLLFWNQQRF